MPDVQEEKQASSLDRFGMEVERFESRQDALLWEQRRRAQFENSGQRFSAQQLLSQSKAQKQVLLGAPGSGKTTLMSYFAVKLALKQPQDLGLTADTDWLPILIRIRDLEKYPDLNPLQFIQQFATVNLSVRSLPTGFFEYWLEDGRTLILLDGLDEVADPAKRSEVVFRLECFLGQYAQNRAIITSRPAGYRRDFFRTDEFPHFELLPFDDSKIEEFTRRWYSSRIADKAEADRRKESLSKALEEQPRIKRLAQNPLLLTIIALIHRYQARLPKERHRLYDKAVETLLTTWDAGREITTHSVLRYLTLDDLRRLMERLAYWIHSHPEGNTGEQEGGTLIDRDELMTQLSKFIREQKKIEPHEARAEAKRFLDHIRDRTGLLNEQGQDCYAFVHKTFQEYLTAQEIRDRQEDEGLEVVLGHIRDHLHDAHWQEVLLLLIAQQRRTNPTKVIQAILEQPTLYENWLHRNLLFAGSCLAEDIEVADELALNVLQRLVELEGKKSLVTYKIRNQVFQILCSLCETRYEAQALQLLKAKGEQIEKIRLSEYQAVFWEKEEAIVMLLELLQDPNTDIHYKAANTLVKLGKDSEPVVQALLGLLQTPDADVRYRAANVLVKLDNGSEPVVQALLGLLQDSNTNVRYRAANVLVRLDNGSEPVVQALIGLLQIPTVDMRRGITNSTTNALVKLGKDLEPVVQALIGLLQNPDADVRYKATNALVKLGKDSEPVVQALIGLLQDSNINVRYKAANALVKLGKDSEPVVQALIGLLQTSDADVRFRAADVLVSLGKHSEPVVQALIGLLQTSDADVRFRAADVLVNLGKDSEPVVQTLLGLLQEPNTDARYRAADALVEIGKDSEPVVQALFGLLQNPGADVRFRAANALVKLGKDSEPVVQALIGLLQDSNINVRYRATEVLVKLGKDSEPVVQALIGLLQNPNADVRYRATDMLVSLGKNSEPVVQALIGLLQNPNADVRYRATEVLVKLGKNSEPVVEVLFGLLRNSSVDVCYGAADMLVSLGKNSEPVVQALLGLLQDPDMFTRHRAAYMLVSLGKDSAVGASANYIGSAVDRWIKQHQDSEYVGEGIDVLWGLVVRE